MASGVSVDDDCLKAFEEIKLGKKYRYIIYRLSDDNTKVIVKKKAELDETYDDFLACVHSFDNGCLYAVYDFHYRHNEMDRQKLVFVLWAPEEAAVKQKMLYTSSKTAIRQKLVGIGVELQANESSELEMEEMASKCCERSQ